MAPPGRAGAMMEAPGGVEPPHRSFAERPKIMTMKRDQERLTTAATLWIQTIEGLGMVIDDD